MSLLNGLMAGTGDVNPEGGSLLDRLSDEAERTSTAWQPHKDADSPKGIEGVVVDVWEREGQYADPATGSVPMIPNIIIQDAEGTNWGIKGFHKVLREEIKKAAPSKGDKMAVLYLGERPSKVRGRKPTHVYKVAVAKAQPADGGPGF